MKLLDIRNNTTDVVLPLKKGSPVSISLSLYDNRTLDSWLLPPKCCDCIKYTDCPSCAASMTLFVFLIATERLLRLRLLLNASVQSLLIRFDTHQVIIALLDDLVQCFFGSEKHQASHQSRSIPLRRATLAQLPAHWSVCVPSASPLAPHPADERTTTPS